MLIADLQWGRGIMNQGMPWENYLQTILPAGSRLAPNAKTFDYFDRETGLAISAKTLDTMTDSRIANPSSIYYTLKGYVDKMDSYAGGVNGGAIEAKQMLVAIPSATTATGMAQINRAIEYAQSLGIVIKTTKVN